MPRSVSRQSVDSDLDSISSTEKPHTPATSETAATAGSSQPPSPAKKRRKSTAANRNTGNVRLPSPATGGVGMVGDMLPPSAASSRLHMPPECMVAQNPFEDSMPRFGGLPLPQHHHHHFGPPASLHQHMPGSGNVGGQSRFLYPMARPIVATGLEQPMGLSMPMMPGQPSMSMPFPGAAQAMFGPPNPSCAPSQYPCGGCHKEVHESDQAVLCESGCSMWFHRQCSGLTEPAFLLLNKEAHAEWVCDLCISKKSIPLVRLRC